MSTARIQTESSPDGEPSDDGRHRAARYLQRLEDARTFVRYAEQALTEAAQLAPDKEAFGEAVSLRNSASQLRRRAMEFKQKGSARFNPKRTPRRVPIDKSWK